MLTKICGVYFYVRLRQKHICFTFLEKLKFRLKSLNMVLSIKVTSRSQQCIMWSTGVDLVLTKICWMYFSCQNTSETYSWCSHIMKTHIVTFTWNFAWNGQNPIFCIKMASRRHQSIVKVNRCWPGVDQNMWNVFFMSKCIRNIFMVSSYLKNWQRYVQLNFFCSRR